MKSMEKSLDLYNPTLMCTVNEVNRRKTETNSRRINSAETCGNIINCSSDGIKSRRASSQSEIVPHEMKREKVSSPNKGSSLKNRRSSLDDLPVLQKPPTSSILVEDSSCTSAKGNLHRRSTLGSPRMRPERSLPRCEQILSPSRAVDKNPVANGLHDEAEGRITSPSRLRTQRLIRHKSVSPSVERRHKSIRYRIPVSPNKSSDHILEQLTRKQDLLNLQDLCRDDGCPEKDKKGEDIKNHHKKSTRTDGQVKKKTRSKSREDLNKDPSVAEFLQLLESTSNDNKQHVKDQPKDLNISRKSRKQSKADNNEEKSSSPIESMSLEISIHLHEKEPSDSDACMNDPNFESFSTIKDVKLTKVQKTASADIWDYHDGKTSRQKSDKEVVSANSPKSKDQPSKGSIENVACNTRIRSKSYSPESRSKLSEQKRSTSPKKGKKKPTTKETTVLSENGKNTSNNKTKCIEAHRSPGRVGRSKSVSQRKDPSTDVSLCESKSQTVASDDQERVKSNCKISSERPNRQGNHKSSNTVRSSKTRKSSTSNIKERLKKIATSESENKPVEENVSIIQEEQKETEKKKILQASRSGPVLAMDRRKAISQEHADIGELLAQLPLESDLDEYQSDSGREQKSCYLPSSFDVQKSNMMRMDSSNDGGMSLRSQRRNSTLSAASFVNSIASSTNDDNDSDNDDCSRSTSNRSSYLPGKLGSTQNKLDMSLSSMIAKSKHDCSTLSMSSSSIGSNYSQSSYHTHEGDAVENILRSRRLRGGSVTRSRPIAKNDKGKEKKKSSFLFGGKDRT